MDANEMAVFITNWMGKRGLVTTSEQAMNVKELCFDVQKAAAEEFIEWVEHNINPKELYLRNWGEFKKKFGVD
jgi:hypothetical protein